MHLKYTILLFICYYLLFYKHYAFLKIILIQTIFTILQNNANYYK